MLNSAFEKMSINSYAQEDEVVEQEIYRIKIIVLGSASKHSSIKMLEKVPSFTSTPSKETHNTKVQQLEQILLQKLFICEEFSAIFKFGIQPIIQVHLFLQACSTKLLDLSSFMILQIEYHIFLSRNPLTPS